MALLILGGRRRRRQVVDHAVVALEHAGDALAEGRIGVQARDLVLILVGHEFEQIAGHGLRQARARARHGALGGMDLVHEGLVLGRIGGVLVGREEVHALGHHLGQRRLLDELDHLGRLEQGAHGSQVMGAAAAPLEGGLVVVGLHAVEFDGAHQRRMRQRHAARLPGVAQDQRVGVDAVAQQLHGHLLGVEAAQQLGAHGLGQCAGAAVVRCLPVRVGDEGCRGRAVAVERHEGAARLHHGHGGRRGRDDGVAADHQVGLGHVHLGGVDGLGTVGDLDVAPGGAALLRQAGRVLGDHALALQVGRHAQQRADGDHARAADAGHDDAPGLLGHRQHGLRDGGQHGQVALFLLLGLLELAAFDGDEAGAKALHAGVVLVAGVLVDAALAAELGLHRLDRQAVGLHRAVAAAFADQFVDDHGLVGRGQRAAFAAAALFGGAGLVVDDGRAALEGAELALDAVQFVAVVHGHALGQRHAVVLGGFVGDDDQFGHALGLEAVHDLQHRVALGPLAHALAARHGHGVVVQQLVGDVHAGRDALAYRQQAAVEVGAVAQVGEDMGVLGEGRLAHPGHALATHLREGAGGAVHPHRHVVAADAGHGAAALGHAGAGVVRTAAAKPWHAVARGLALGDLERGLAGVQHGNALVHALGDVFGHADLGQALDDGARDEGRRQVRIGAQQPVLAGIGHRPFAAVLIAELADHVGPHVGAPVVQLFLDLVFDDLALFLHHQDFLQAAREVARDGGLQRPDHVDLVHAYAQLAAGVVVQAQVGQGLAHVVVGLSAGDQAEAVVGTVDHVVVEPVGAHIGQGRIPLVVHQPLLLLQRRIGPADVQAAGRHLEVLGQDDVHAVWLHRHAGRGLDHLLDGLHARPQAREAAHGKGMQAHVQDVLHIAGKEHRRAAGLEDVVALVGGRAALADVVVAGQRDHAAVPGGARHVGVLEHVGAAVHARALAVPQAEDAVELLGLGIEIQLLRAPDGRGAQLFIDAGLEDDVVGFEVLFRGP